MTVLCTRNNSGTPTHRNYSRDKYSAVEWIYVNMAWKVRPSSTEIPCKDSARNLCSTYFNLQWQNSSILLQNDTKICSNILQRKGIHLTCKPVLICIGSHTQGITCHVAQTWISWKLIKMSIILKRQCCEITYDYNPVFWIGLDTQRTYCDVKLIGTWANTKYYHYHSNVIAFGSVKLFIECATTKVILPPEHYQQVCLGIEQSLCFFQTP